MKRSTTKNIFIAFILNLIFSIFELIGGIFTNSVSIIADSLHDFGDAVSILISLLLEKYSKKKPNSNYTYGYLRYSTFGAFITCVILLVGSIIVIFSSIIRLIDPVNVNYNGMLFLSIIGISVNLIATKITSCSHNLNEKAVSLHMLEDVLGWVCVFIGSIVIRFTDMHILDPILSIGVSIFILINLVKKFKDIFDIFLEKKPNIINIEELKSHLLSINEVIDVHHLHIWSIDGVNNYITLHVLIDGNILSCEIDKIKCKINKKLIEHGICHSTVEFETKKCDSNDCNVNAEVHAHHHH